MTQQDAANAIGAGIAATQTTLTALEAAQQILQEGYTSDSDANNAAIAEGISAGIDAAVSSATGPLNAQLAILRGQVFAVVTALQDTEAADDTARVQNALAVLQ
jgi:hypothetical protein